MGRSGGEGAACILVREKGGGRSDAMVRQDGAGAAVRAGCGVCSWGRCGVCGGQGGWAVGWHTVGTVLSQGPIPSNGTALCQGALLITHAHGWGLHGMDARPPCTYERESILVARRCSTVDGSERTRLERAGKFPLSSLSPN